MKTGGVEFQITSIGLFDEIKMEPALFSPVPLLRRLIAFPQPR